jgi:hypothetical protein
LCYDIHAKNSELKISLELPRNGFKGTRIESGHLSNRKGEERRGEERISIKLSLGKQVGSGIASSGGI